MINTNFKTLRIVFSFFFISSFISIHSQEMSIFDIARKGSLTELKLKVSKDADIINKKSKEGYTPLTLACYYSNNEVAKYLVENVKDVNNKSGFGTPIMAAAVKNNIELVALLLKYKADPNAIDQNGSTALHFSAIFSFEEIIKLLVTAKADTTLKDNRGKTALEYAEITGNKTIIELLTSKTK